MELAKCIDHTLLRTDARQADLEKLTAEAKAHGFASVCVSPIWVTFAAQALRESGVKVCTVIGFPQGATPSAVKAFETKQAIADGAEEVDMVIAVGRLKDGDDAYVKADIEAVVRAAKGRALTKVIIETCLLTDEEKRRACRLAKEAGADFVKTSTGFSTGGATAADVKLMRESVGEALGVKASGGVRSRADAEAEKQNIVTGSGDQDAVGMARSGLGAVVMVFLIRAGKMVGREHFLLSGSEEETDEALLSAFLKQYYHRAAFVPREILLPFPIEETELLESWLAERKGAKVALAVPQRGTKHDVVEMVRSNAEKFLADEAARIEQANDQTLGAVRELGCYLGLKEEPMRMECFDISHNQGSETVASMVVFEGGLPKKSDYRRFKIRSAEGKPDDFLSMREVTQRRYGKLSEDELPDLIIIDGGKGQLSSALEIIRNEAGHKDVPVVGLAKQFELIFTEGNSEPVELPRRSQSLYLVQRIRDEAHRFAITFHRKLRGKRNLVSVLDHIVGVGPKRRQSLWSHFGTLDKIKAASVDELVAAPGMNRPAAEAIVHFFDAQRALRGKD